MTFSAAILQIGGERLAAEWNLGSFPSVLSTGILENPIC